jgi:hypothetical protein
MDQMASQDQAVLRRHRECSQDESLDRHCRYVLVAIVKKLLNTNASLYTVLQILSLTLLEKMSLDQLVKNMETQIQNYQDSNQLNLFN